MKKSLIIILMVFGLISMGCQISIADPLNVWNGWTEFQTSDNVGNIEDYVGSHDYNGTMYDEYVNPGWGGQDFDAEYLFYQYDVASTTLSIGLQTGFDIIEGLVNHVGKDYYAGDLALSFGGLNYFNYGIDFGFGAQYGYYTDTSSVQPVQGQNAGLYSVSSWNNNVYSGYTASNPFAISAGSAVDNAGFSSSSGFGLSDTSNNLTSYYQKVSFNVSKIAEQLNAPGPELLKLSDFSFKAHWTMSCGNDAIDGEGVIFQRGYHHAPEPATFVLMFLGLLGLVGVRRMKK